MDQAVTYPHIEKRAGVPACLHRMPRIRVAQIIMDYIFHGMSPEEICRQYPHLKPAEVHAAFVKDLEIIAKASDPGDWVSIVERLPY